MEFEFSDLMFAFSLTLLAGLSTGIGSLISLLTNKTNKKFLSIALGFSAGVMIYVSFVEILDEAKFTLIAELGERKGSWITVVGFFLGILIIAIIDKFIPESHNPHEAHTVEELDGNSEHHKNSLMRTGLFSALAIADPRSLVTGSDAALGVYSNIESASPTFFPRIKSITIFTFLEEIRI